ncbi:uncharacterized protein LOC110914371 [Helianthus annuus]|uniref:uncharacterized protein LOC110914371 n=1 Tax=Helianthus annuus TaxID=4232 RepID=UPI000B906437|nr:uncharacterized protein LOC110914371 [Helianthus annuus]
MLKNDDEFGNLTLSQFIEKLEVQEMEQRKMARMKDFNGEQDIGLYYKGDSTAEEELAYAYYQSQQYSPKKIEEEPVLKEKVSEKVSERAPVFDHSSDEKSDDDSEEIRKLEFYARKFSSDNDNLCFAGKIEKIKEKQAAKKKNHKAATDKEKDDSDDDNSYYAGKMKEILAAKDDSDDENVRLKKKQDLSYSGRHESV